MAKLHVSCTVNGDEVEFLCAPEETLIDVVPSKASWSLSATVPLPQYFRLIFWSCNDEFGV